MPARKVILRDDDTSFFTTPQMLEQIYRPFWARGIPVSLAVIPAQNSATRVLHRPNLPHDPGIPPPYRGRDVDHPLHDNPALCEFLNAKAKAGLVEICLHGYRHSYHEYLEMPPDQIATHLEQGLALLRAALPDAPIHTFIAPYDVMSAPAVEQVLARGYHLCTNSANLGEHSLLAGMQSHEQRTLPGGQHVTTCDEYFFTHRDAPQDCVARAQERLAQRELVVIANHYWCFFYDWGTGTPLLEAWLEFADDLLNRVDIEFATFGRWRG